MVKAKSRALEPVTSTLERVKVPSPTLVSVTVTGVLELPTAWLAKSMLARLNANPGVGGGGTSILPAPPQDMHHKAIATQAVARITILRSSGGCALAFIPNYSSARVTSRKPLFQAPPTSARMKVTSSGTRSPIVNTKASRIGDTQDAHLPRLFRPLRQFLPPPFRRVRERYDCHSSRLMTSCACVNAVIAGVS